MKMLIGADCFEFGYPLHLGSRECLQHSNWPLLELRRMLCGTELIVPKAMQTWISVPKHAKYKLAQDLLPRRP